MRVGIFGYRAFGAPRLVELASIADEFGYDALWMGEHVARPVETTSVHPTRRDNNAPPRAIELSPGTLLDPFVVLSAAAGATNRLCLATGICILPLQHPLAASRAAASLHDVSSGRFLFGVGAGWRTEEFAALATPMHGRFGRMIEQVEILRRSWQGVPFDHHGTYYDFDYVQVTDTPADIPIVFGGNSDAALRRAARLGDAWIASEVPTFDQAAQLNERMRELLDDQGKKTFRRFFRVEADQADRIDRYIAEGIEDLIFLAHDICPAGVDIGEALQSFSDRIGLP